MMYAYSLVIPFLQGLTNLKILLLKGRLQCKYKFVLKVAFLFTDIPAENIFSEKSVSHPPGVMRYNYLTNMASHHPTHNITSLNSWRHILLLMPPTPVRLEIMTHSTRRTTSFFHYVKLSGSRLMLRTMW